MADEYFNENYLKGIQILPKTPAGSGDITKKDALLFAGIILVLGIGGYLFNEAAKKRQQESTSDVSDVIWQSMTKHPEVPQTIADQLGPKQQLANDIRKIFTEIPIYIKG